MRSDLVNTSKVNGELLEKVILGNDLSGLTSLEKVNYVKSICDSVGLNPVTRPIQIMKFQGKEVPYFSKDATEQLRKLNKVSITKIEKDSFEGVYVVTAYARTPDGREDSSTGVLATSGLKGDALANAMMKAETKAKRRVTLSICGLGFIDECEVDSIKGATKVTVKSDEPPLLEAKQNDDFDQLKIDYPTWEFHIEACANLNQLKEIYEELKASEMKKLPDLYKQLIKKIEDARLKFINGDTGEVKE